MDDCRELRRKLCRHVSSAIAYRNCRQADRATAHAELLIEALIEHGFLDYRTAFHACSRA